MGLVSYIIKPWVWIIIIFFGPLHGISILFASFGNCPLLTQTEKKERDEQLNKREFTDKYFDKFIPTKDDIPKKKRKKNFRVSWSIKWEIEKWVLDILNWD